MIKETKKEMKAKKENTTMNCLKQCQMNLMRKEKGYYHVQKRKVPLPGYLLSPLESLGTLLTSKSLKML